MQLHEDLLEDENFLSSFEQLSPQIQLTTIVEHEEKLYQFCMMEDDISLPLIVCQPGGELNSILHLTNFIECLKKCEKSLKAEIYESSINLFSALESMTHFPNISVNRGGFGDEISVDLLSCHCLGGKASCFAKLGAWEECHQICQQMIELAPLYPLSQLRYGGYLIGSGGSVKEALPYLVLGVQLLPSFEPWIIKKGERIKAMRIIDLWISKFSEDEDIIEEEFLSHHPLDKYPSTPHFPFSPGLNSDDIISTTSSTSNFGFEDEEVVITEKLDGGNCCLYKGTIYARTHKHPTDHDWFGPVKDLYSTLRITHPALIQFLDHKDVKIFGENLFAVHSIDYNTISSVLYIFGMYGKSLVLEDGEEEVYLWYSWDEVKSIASLLGLETPKEVFRGSLNDIQELSLQLFLEHSIENPSMLSEGDDEVVCPEGFVVRSVNSFQQENFERNVMKYVRRDHVQTESNWARTWKKANIQEFKEKNEEDNEEMIIESMEIDRIKCEISLWMLRRKDEETKKRNNDEIKEDEEDNNKPLQKFPRTHHLFNTGGSAVTRDDLVLEGEDRNCFFGRSLIIQEKIDGANLGFTLTSDYEIRAQNRSHFVSSSTSEQFKSLDTWISSHSIEICSILEPNKHVLYGEWCYAEHSIPYLALPDYFIAFDIFDRIEGRFLSVQRVEKILSETSIFMVPLVEVGKQFSDEEEVSDYLYQLKSQFRDDDGYAEGIIMRIESDDNQWLENRSKLVRNDFIQGIEDGEHWIRKTLKKNKIKY